MGKSAKAKDYVLKIFKCWFPMDGSMKDLLVWNSKKYINFG